MTKVAEWWNVFPTLILVPHRHRALVLACSHTHMQNNRTNTYAYYTYIIPLKHCLDSKNQSKSNPGSKTSWRPFLTEANSNEIAWLPRATYLSSTLQFIMRLLGNYAAYLRIILQFVMRLLSNHPAYLRSNLQFVMSLLSNHASYLHITLQFATRLLSNHAACLHITLQFVMRLLSNHGHVPEQHSTVQRHTVSFRHHSNTMRWTFAIFYSPNLKSLKDWCCLT